MSNRQEPRVKDRGGGRTRETEQIEGTWQGGQEEKGRAVGAVGDLFKRIWIEGGRFVLKSLCLNVTKFNPAFQSNISSSVIVPSTQLK